jgi:hypothetical protein
MDTQIWYTIFSTLFGGIYGAFQRLGEVCLLIVQSCLFIILQIDFILRNGFLLLALE